MATEPPWSLNIIRFGAAFNGAAAALYATMDEPHWWTAAAHLAFLLFGLWALWKIRKIKR